MKAISRHVGVCILSILFVNPFLFSYSFAQTKVFIGINGGASEYENFSSFEDDLTQFSKKMATSGYQIRTLNGGGPNGKNIRIINSTSETAPAWERDANGNLLLRANLYSGEVASNENIEALINQTKIAKPNSVVLLFRDHGNEDGFATWHDMMPYEEISKIGDTFDPTTLVRQIHMYCYSGNALLRFKPVFDWHSLLNSFPANRCAFSSSNVDEFSYEKNGLSDFLKTNNPSLQSLKSFFEKDDQYSPTPMLTSDLLKDEILWIACDNSIMDTSCNNQQRNNLKQLVCKTYQYNQVELKKTEDRFFQFSKNEENLKQKFSKLIEKFLATRYPNESKVKNEIQRQVEIRKGSVFSPLLEPMKPLSLEQKKALNFINTKKLSLTRGRGLMTDTNKLKNECTLNSCPNEVEDPDKDGLIKFLKKCKQDTIFKQMHDAQVRTLNAQKEKKLIRSKLYEARELLVKQVTRILPEIGIQSVLDNLEKCETLPLSEDHI